MQELSRLAKISQLSGKDPNWIHKDLFRLLRKKDLWILAYENVKGNKGALTPGVGSDTMDGMSLNRLERLRDQVCSEQYDFKPVKLVKIQRPDGKLRPLGLPTANDKIVQECIRIILEVVYEPIFSPFSFGFRPQKGCHDALAHVENRFRWVDWVIEGDIEQAYPAIDHHILIKCLKEKIDDPRFINLIWKLLRSGVLDEGNFIWSPFGVPQGSIVSPILANIYFHKFDQKIYQIWDQHATKNPSKLKSKSYKALEYKIGIISRQLDDVDLDPLDRKQLRKEIKTLVNTRNLSVDSSLKYPPVRVEYVRYADDWMVGIKGPESLAVKIKQELSEFFETKLKQKLSPEKTKITNLRKGNANFLGYEIYLPAHRSLTEYRGSGKRTVRRTNPKLRFELPVKRIVKRYVSRGYLRFTPYAKDPVRPISRSAFAILEDHVIIQHYKSLWFGLQNYYSGCTRPGMLQYFHYLLKMSCAMTLAHRHRSSSAKIFRKHGKNLTVRIPGTEKTVNYPDRKTWRYAERHWKTGKSFEDPTVRYSNIRS